MQTWGPEAAGQPRESCTGLMSPLPTLQFILLFSPLTGFRLITGLQSPDSGCFPRPVASQSQVSLTLHSPRLRRSSPTPLTALHIRAVTGPVLPLELGSLLSWQRWLPP